MAISTTGGKEHLIGVLRAACANISHEAEEIIGDITNVSKIAVTITLTPTSVVTYEVNRTKFAHFEEKENDNSNCKS